MFWRSNVAGSGGSHQTSSPLAAAPRSGDVTEGAETGGREEKLWFCLVVVSIKECRQKGQTFQGVGVQWPGGWWWWWCGGGMDQSVVSGGPVWRQRRPCSGSSCYAAWEPSRPPPRCSAGCRAPVPPTTLNVPSHNPQLLPQEGRQGGRHPRDGGPSIGCRIWLFLCRLPLACCRSTTTSRSTLHHHHHHHRRQLHHLPCCCCCPACPASGAAAATAPLSFLPVLPPFGCFGGLAGFAGRLACYPNPLPSSSFFSSFLRHAAPPIVPPLAGCMVGDGQHGPKHRQRGPSGPQASGLPSMIHAPAGSTASAEVPCCGRAGRCHLRPRAGDSSPHTCIMDGRR